MKRRTLIATLVSVLALLLVGCGSKQTTGAAVGAGGGAAAGYAVTDSPVGALVGAFVGAVVGAEIGRAMDEQDRIETAQALEYAPTGEPVAWRNPDTGYRYQVTPVETYEQAYRGHEGPCREFTMDAWIGGRLQETWGVACRQPDGSWRIISS